MPAAKRICRHIHRVYAKRLLSAGIVDFVCVYVLGNVTGMRSLLQQSAHPSIGLTLDDRAVGLYIQDRNETAKERCIYSP